MKAFLHTFIASIVLSGLAAAEVRISDGVDEGMAAFVIETETAIYYYQKEAGGFSSILDLDGNDWLGWNRSEAEAYPASAASDFRGLPNMVFQSADGGAGHPGYYECESIQLDGKSIQSVSKSGKWRWTWTFTAQDATLRVEAIDPDHPYWFLYEGPIAGRFAPDKQYWGTNQKGPIRTFPDYYKTGGLVDNWRWVYFGDNELDRIFVLEHLQDDSHLDLFGYLGNTDAGLDSPDGMVVFGFGRALDAKALLRETPNTFRISFHEFKVTNAKDHDRLKEILQSKD